jgi:D-3-phosphoglycerate dehydrogenase
VAYDPFASAFPEGIESVGLDELFATADVLSLHCPLTRQNANMINAATLATMRDGAIIVNTARGGLIDEAALAEALRSGKLRAVGLDSFQVEPFSGGHEFTGLHNAVLTPHIAGVTADAYIGMGTGAARNILEELAV